MKRRNFLKNVGGLSLAPLVLNGTPLHSFTGSSMFPLVDCQGISDRVMVIVFLKGANDGINTLVPINQYDTYANIRPDIKITNTGGNAYIPLDATLAIEDQVGLHPSMLSFKNMYDAGLASLVQGVGYPSPNRSHFKSTDLWLSGGDGTPANFNLDGGWMGRYLESAYPAIFGQPSNAFPDPLGIQLGDSKPSGGFHNHDRLYVASNLSGQDPSNLFGLLSGLGAAPLTTLINSEYGDAIEYIMNTENATNIYGERITNVYNAGMNSSVTYPDTNLGDQLKTVARLISGGSTTKIFLVHKTGFDTHANQVQSGDTHLGTHANLLADVFDSIKAFHDDMTDMGIEQKVMTVTFSEFGRKAVQNGSFGTDHGNHAPMFLFGSAVEAGVYGTNVNLGDLTDNGNLQDSGMQYDYRGVFKTLIQDWLGAGQAIINGTLFNDYTKIPSLVTAAHLVDPECYLEPVAFLPVELEAFEASLLGKNQVLIRWQTSSEVNLDYYEVQRSRNGRDFELLEKVQGLGDQYSIQEYDLIDEAPYSGLSYYRLKSVDRDASISYSDIRSVEIENNHIKQVKLYPNPARYDTNLVMTLAQAEELQLSIYSVEGRLVRSTQWSGNEGFNKFNIDLTGIQQGHYLLKAKTKDTPIPTLNLLVQ
ncbi:MAG: DUF1501 domain-containing protein [Bacteroidota bacterium]